RNLDRQRLVLLYTTDAMARHAGIGNDLARSVTRRTRLLDREKSLRDAHFAAAVTCRAGLRTGARLRAGAVTGFARLHRRYANLDFGPARGLLEREVEVVAKIRAAIHAVAAAAASRLTENFAEDIAECVGESAEALGTAEAARARGAEARRWIDAGMTELIVSSALTRVGQDVV